MNIIRVCYTERSYPSQHFEINFGGSKGAAMIECAFAFCWVALFLAAMLQILALTDAGIMTVAQVNSEAVGVINRWKETHMQQDDVERPCLEKIPGGSIKGETRELPIGFGAFRKKISLKQEVKLAEGKICIFN